MLENSKKYLKTTSGGIRVICVYLKNKIRESQGIPLHLRAMKYLEESSHILTLPNHFGIGRHGSGGKFSTAMWPWYWTLKAVFLPKVRKVIQAEADTDTYPWDFLSTSFVWGLCYGLNVPSKFICWSLKPSSYIYDRACDRVW